MNRGPRTHHRLPAVLAIWLVGIVALVFAPFPAPAAAQALPYVHDLRQLPHGLRLPLRDERRTVTPSPSTLRQRAAATLQDPTIDPIELHLPHGGQERAAFLARLAAPGQLPALRRYAAKRRAAAPGATKDTVRLDTEGLALVDQAALLATLAQPHHHLSLSTTPLRQSALLRRALISELEPYLDAAELATVLANVAAEGELDVDRELLPRIARASVGQFTKYRGPNCFRTALSFQDPRLPSLPAVNSKAEPGFHAAMINNDELWYALTHEFFEVDTARERLRYGDVLVFFDVPNEGGPIDYRWLKHASTYLLSDYTYSKESYAANSPHTVKRLSDEWQTWQRRLPHFAVKVYRKVRTKGP